MHESQREMHLPYALAPAIIASMQKDRTHEILARLIQAAGKRPTEVARESGVNQTTLSRILSRGIETPTDRQVVRLAGYFDLTSEQIRGRQPISDADMQRIMGVTSSAAALGGNIADIRFSLKPKSDDLVMHDTEVVEGGEPLRPDEVELPYLREVEFAAGSGRTQVIENHGRTMRFSLPRLAKAGVQPENAACATAMGTSMEPTIVDGSPIAIDRGCTHVIDGKIYALDHGGMLRIKRLYRMPLNRVRLVSDNSDEHPEETYSLLGDEAPVILGRVFWWEVFD